MEPGSRLAHYEIVGPLGAGGMGEVYRARDTTLDREVAIKVLPADVAGNAEQLARLEREAKLLAQLNHAAIATVHGFHADQGVHFLVMELVPGVSLDEHIAASGALEVEEALRIARQIATALEAAHAAGIIHRDLKPANVIVTPEGDVKVLDFGLAKGTDGEDGQADLSASPTMAAATVAGVILGTAAYMSPEQARGQELDARTDIWAFGCVLYEMLAGSQAFAGDTVSDIMAGILRAEPDLGALPQGTPAPARKLLRRCLNKDRRQRLQHIGDARIEIGEMLDGVDEGVPVATLPPAASGPGRVIVGGALIAGLILGGLGVRALLPPVTASVEEAPRRFTILADLTRRLLDNFAVSRDGRTVAWVAADGRLLVRNSGEFEPRPLEGVSGAESPFFSPDGRWIAYWANGAIYRVPTAGGRSERVVFSSRILGGYWTDDGRIIFSEFVSPLRGVPASGGEATAVTTRLEDQFDVTHHSPHVLPGDRGVLFESDYRVAAATLDGGETVFLLDDAANPVYSPSGHILFSRRDGSLWAAPFDPETLQLTGEPFTAQPERVRGFQISDDGTLVFQPFTAGSSTRMVWVDREGNIEPLGFEPAPYQSPRVSPDGKRIAVTSLNSIWIFDVERGTRSLFAGDGADNRWPVWTNRGARVAFTSTREPSKPLVLLSQAPGSTGPPDSLMPDRGVAIPISWSESGAELAYYSMDGPYGDIKVLAADGTVTDLVSGPADERSPMFSPDGRHLAYISNESGRDEIYVAPYPAMEPRVLVSNAGGIAPTWAPDGSELYYRDDAGMQAVRLRAGEVTEFDAPELLFPNGDFLFSEVRRGNANYGIAPDGRFLMVEAADDVASRTLSVVLGWVDELQRRDSELGTAARRP